MADCGHHGAEKAVDVLRDHLSDHLEGWGVDILWPDGETEVVKGFITEQDAAKWIAEHSKAWQGNTNDKPPQTL
jgi:hypothetical protein